MKLVFIQGRRNRGCQKSNCHQKKSKARPSSKKTLISTAIQYRASTGPEQGFPCVVIHHRKRPIFFGWDPCNENRFFPVRKATQGKPCFHYKDGFAVRAWVIKGAEGAWHLQIFWTILSGTNKFWQFYYIILCFNFKIWVFTSDWHPLFQIPNSSPVYY